MTDEAAAAKKLFDEERWTAALERLTRVAAGATGDDEGNRQLAEWYIAIALFRQNRYAESASTFRAITNNPEHIKHREALLWLAKLVTIPESFEVFSPFDLQAYTIDDVRRFANAQQQDVYVQLLYMLGVERYRAGQVAEAIALFDAIPKESRYRPDADACTDIAKLYARETGAESR